MIDQWGLLWQTKKGDPKGGGVLGAGQGKKEVLDAGQGKKGDLDRGT